MDVLLVRHGAAVSAGARLADEHRWLTDEGRRTTLRVGERLRGHGLRPTVLYTSPLVRAVQTTEILAEVFGARVEVHPDLSTERGSPAQALSVLDRHADAEVVVLVTHEPKIRGMAASLAQARAFPGFGTSGAALFRGPRAGMAFGLAIDPETLELVYSAEKMATF